MARTPVSRTRRSQPDVRAMADLLKALGHPVRLRMLAGLCQSECNVGRLWKHLGISQPLASQHLNRMRRAGLVIGERRGQETCYRIADPRVARLLDDVRQYAADRPGPEKKTRRRS